MFDNLQEVFKDDLIRPTCGDIDSTRSKFLVTKSSASRVTLDRKIQVRHALLRFRFRGATETKYFGTREKTWRQIGFKLFEANPCNLIYVMWRIQKPEDLQSEPESIVVAVKHNPGLTSSAKCGHHGYTELASWRPSVSATDREMHLFRCQVITNPTGATLTINVDDCDQFAVSLTTDMLTSSTGTTGLRTDNGSFIFKYFVAE